MHSHSHNISLLLVHQYIWMSSCLCTRYRSLECGYIIIRKILIIDYTIIIIIIIPNFFLPCCALSLSVCQFVCLQSVCLFCFNPYRYLYIYTHVCVCVCVLACSLVARSRSRSLHILCFFVCAISPVICIPRGGVCVTSICTGELPSPSGIHDLIHAFILDMKSTIQRISFFFLIIYFFHIKKIRKFVPITSL